MPYKLNGRIIPIGKTWTDDDGVKHPSNWATAWSDEYKTEIGIVWVEPELYVKPDNRFYNFSGEAKSLDDVDTGEVDETGNPIIVEGLKTIAINRVKQRAFDLLAKTDWMVFRFVETGTVIPNAVQTRRANIRQRSTQIIQAVNACTTIDEFKALFESIGGSSPIIEDWPES